MKGPPKPSEMQPSFRREGGGKGGGERGVDKIWLSHCGCMGASFGQYQPVCVRSSEAQGPFCGMLLGARQALNGIFSSLRDPVVHPIEHWYLGVVAEHP